MNLGHSVDALGLRLGELWIGFRSFRGASGAIMCIFERFWVFEGW